jgi:CheY-like chemotaxis protein
LFQARGAEIAVVVTDIMMPRMGGVELITALRRLNPDVKVVVFSGMMPEDKRQELAALGLRDVLRKPYESRSLLDAIHHALGGPAT